MRNALGGDDITTGRAVIAVQGPHAADRLAPVFPAAATVGRFRVEQHTWNGIPCTVAGTGYTGERGVEIAVPAVAALDLWDALADAGVTPAGLGARDTLRLEAGLPLHGHELGAGITSLQAGLGWVVAWDKPTFRGRDAALAERSRGHLAAAVRHRHRRSPTSTGRVPGLDRRRRWSARSRAATSHRCSVTGSPSRSCRRRPRKVSRS